MSWAPYATRKFSKNLFFESGLYLKPLQTHSFIVSEPVPSLSLSHKSREQAKRPLDKEFDNGEEFGCGLSNPRHFYQNNSLFSQRIIPRMIRVPDAINVGIVYRFQYTSGSWDSKEFPASNCLAKNYSWLVSNSLIDNINDRV